MKIEVLDTPVEVSLASSIVTKLETLNTYMKSLSNTKFQKLPDDEPIDLLAKIGDLLDNMISITPLIGMKISALTEGLAKRFVNFEETHKNLLGMIHDREQSRVQPNTMATQYDEEHLISRFEFSPYGSEVSGIQMIQITDPARYSNLSLIKQIEMSTEDLSEIRRRILDNLIVMEKKHIPLLIQEINQDRDLLGSAEMSCLLSNDPQKRENIRFECLCKQGVVLAFINDLKKTIQIVNELAHNYAVYSQVVQSYTTVTLESVYSPSNIITY